MIQESNEIDLTDLNEEFSEEELQYIRKHSLQHVALMISPQSNLKDNQNNDKKHNNNKALIVYVTIFIIILTLVIIIILR